MAFKLFEDAYNKRRNDFYSHVRPEYRALAERKERITKDELKQMKVTAPIEAQKENGQCERDAEVDSKMAEKEAGK